MNSKELEKGMEMLYLTEKMLYTVYHKTMAVILVPTWFTGISTEGGVFYG